MAFVESLSHRNNSRNAILSQTHWEDNCFLFKLKCRAINDAPPHVSELNGGMTTWEGVSGMTHSFSGELLRRNDDTPGEYKVVTTAWTQPFYDDPVTTWYKIVGAGALNSPRQSHRAAQFDDRHGIEITAVVFRDSKKISIRDPILRRVRSVL